MAVVHGVLREGASCGAGVRLSHCVRYFGRFALVSGAAETMIARRQSSRPQCRIAIIRAVQSTQLLAASLLS